MCELESILKKLAPEIEIVARQDSVRGSVQWLKENQVDLIFSDVHLGDGRSFDIFGQVEIKAPVIFITAYDEYALQAFKSQGIDYILKPFDEEEILRALEKVRNWFAKEKKAPRTVYQIVPNPNAPSRNGNSPAFRKNIFVLPIF